MRFSLFCAIFKLFHLQKISYHFFAILSKQLHNEGRFGNTIEGSSVHVTILLINRRSIFRSKEYQKIEKLW